MKLPKLTLALLALACASAQAGAIKGNLTGLRTESGSSGVFSSPVLYNVTIKTAKTGEIEGITIIETGSSTSSDPYSYPGTYYPAPTPENPEPTPIPGTYRETNTYRSTNTSTSTYDFGAKSFGGTITSAGTSSSSSQTTFVPTDPTIAPFVTNSSNGTPRSSTDKYSDGGLASVKSKKGRVQIKLMQPSSSTETGYTSNSTSTTTIEVKPGSKPKMTLSYLFARTSQDTGSAPTSYSETVAASGKAKGDLDAKVRPGTRKMRVTKTRQ